MRKRRFTELVSLMIEPEALNKLRRVSDDSEVSMSEWLRELVYKELHSLSFEEKSVIELSNSDQGINENDHDQKKQHSTSNDDLSVKKKVS